MTATSTGAATGAYQAFKVEQRGIELVPDDLRPMRPPQLFWLWAGAIFNVEFLIYGVLLVSPDVFGLSFGQAVFTILVGNLAYAFLGVASLQGPETGTTAFGVSRAPFGRNGNRVVSTFNWLTQVGFEVLGLVLIVQAVEAMFARGGVGVGDALRAVVIVAAVGLQVVIPFLGHATITRVLRLLSYVFIVLFVVMAVLVVPHVHLGHVHQHGSWQQVSTALVLVISAGGLGWTENGNDYSRYLPRRTPKAHTFLAAFLGAAIPSVLLELLGAAAVIVAPKITSVTGLPLSAVPLAGVPQSFASWFFWPFLLFALPQLFAINTLDLYSSGVTLQAMGVRVPRWGAVLIDTVVAGAATFLVVFKGNFANDLQQFLDYIVIWLGPWFGVLATDWLLRRGRYDLGALAAERGGLYWRRGGVHWPALIAQAAGMVVATLWIFGKYYSPSYVGVISSATGGSDFSWAAGIVVGAAVYALLAGAGVRREAAATAAP
ncbi:MAG TPA: cytosine permease [Acidimicrobiales bacterium]|nr:cytosine permease [Acidimicrobiales bacterium]